MRFVLAISLILACVTAAAAQAHHSHPRDRPDVSGNPSTAGLHSIATDVRDSKGGCDG